MSIQLDKLNINQIKDLIIAVNGLQPVSELFAGSSYFNFDEVKNILNQMYPKPKQRDIDNFIEALSQNKTKVKAQIVPFLTKKTIASFDLKNESQAAALIGLLKNEDRREAAFIRAFGLTDFFAPTYMEITDELRSFIGNSIAEKTREVIFLSSMNVNTASELFDLMGKVFDGSGSAQIDNIKKQFVGMGIPNVIMDWFFDYSMETLHSNWRINYSGTVINIKLIEALLEKLLWGVVNKINDMEILGSLSTLVNNPDNMNKVVEMLAAQSNNKPEHIRTWLNACDYQLVLRKFIAHKTYNLQSISTYLEVEAKESDALLAEEQAKQLAEQQAEQPSVLVNDCKGSIYKCMVFAESACRMGNNRVNRNEKVAALDACKKKFIIDSIYGNLLEFLKIASQYRPLFKINNRPFFKSDFSETRTAIKFYAELSILLNRSTITKQGIISLINSGINGHFSPASTVAQIISKIKQDVRNRVTDAEEEFRRPALL